MTSDLSTLSDTELRARWLTLHDQVEQAGCPRDVVLAYNAVDDELFARIDTEPPVCSLPMPEGHSFEDVWEQRPGPEWGA